MIGDSYRAKFEKHIADAKERGAKVLVGGGRPANLSKGFFHEPTVLKNVDQSMLIKRQETIGHAVQLISYSTFDEDI